MDLDISRTVFLPFGVYNLNKVSLEVKISVAVPGKRSSSSDGSENSGPGEVQQSDFAARNYVSDTTRDLVVNGTYQFRITSTDEKV